MRPRSRSICPGFTAKAEAIAHGLVDPGYAIVADFVTPGLVAALRTEAEAVHATGGFRPAGIGRGATWHLRPDVRGDEVHWVDPERARVHQRSLLDVMERLRVQLNRALFLGLTGYEAHLAVYPAGTAYHRHRDAHAGTDARRVTTTLYLNDDWQPGDGGTLRLFLPDGDHLDVPPRGGLLLVFASQELDHEVREARRPRLSWTGWFRRDEGV